MRRENRGNNSKTGANHDKVILYTGIGVAILAVIVFALLMYSKSLDDEVKNSTMSLGKMANLIEENTQNIQSVEDTESASTDIGKTVEESQSEIDAKESNDISNSNSTNGNVSNTSQNSTSNNTINNTINNQNANLAKSNNENTSKKEETNEDKETTKELNFQMPVEGEICKEYAKDNLIYSATLDEWTTHMGIDIQAEKTTIVKAAEEGVVKSIKNDPRYGLTIVIEHANNFQTVYSNLLTSEFVVEGEKVEKGQSIGTVGNTAVFEIADEPHLHFEILKNSLPEDPNIYIK